MKPRNTLFLKLGMPSPRQAPLPINPERFDPFLRSWAHVIRDSFADQGVFCILQGDVKQLEHLKAKTVFNKPVLTQCISICFISTGFRFNCNHCFWASTNTLRNLSGDGCNKLNKYLEETKNWLKPIYKNIQISLFISSSMESRFSRI